MRTAILKEEYVHSGYQILVNREHPVRQSVVCNSMKLVPVDSEYADVSLEANTTALLSQLLKSIGCGNGILPVSGYRSRSEQEKIYNDSLVMNGNEFTQQYVSVMSVIRILK